MSRTDKTRPYWVKLAEIEKADPFQARRQNFLYGRMDLNGCPHSCWMCRGDDYSEKGKRRIRREGRRQARDWRKDYE